MVEETPEPQIAQKPVETAETVAEIQPVVEKPAKPWLKIVLFSILGIVLAAGLVFAGYKFAQLRQVQPGPQPTPTPGLVATPTPDETANWKTYTNTKVGFSIKYPVNWLVFDCSASFYEEQPLYVHFSDDERENCNISAKAMMLRVSLNFLKDFDPNSPFDYPLFRSFENLQKENIQIGEKEAILITGTREIVGDEGEKLPSEPEAKEKVVIVPYGNNLSIAIHYTQVYRLKQGVPSSGFYVKPDAKDTFNLMLSTFKFLEESDEAQIKKVLDEYIPEHSLVKVFELEGLKILGNFTKVTVVPKDVVTDKAMVILEKSGGEWSVIWGPGTAIGKMDPVLEKIPEGLLE